MVLGTVWDILYAKIFVANISLSPALNFFCPNIVSSARLLSIFLFFDSLVLTVTLYIEFGRLVLLSAVCSCAPRCYLLLRPVGLRLSSVPAILGLLPFSSLRWTTLVLPNYAYNARMIYSFLLSCSMLRGF